MNRRRLLTGVAPLGVLLLVLGLGCKGGKGNGDDVMSCTPIAFAPSIGSPGAAYPKRAWWRRWNASTRFPSAGMFTS